VAGLLFVVSREQPQLYEYLVRSLSGSDAIEIVLDRRHHDRRGGSVAPARERRRRQRRIRPDEPAQFFPLGYTIVRRPERRTWLGRFASAARA
jgi:hypothetical protein